MIEERKFPEKGRGESRSGFIFYNDEVAKSIIDSITDMVRPGDVIVAYHYKDEVVLVHPGRYFGRKGACSAGKQLLKVIENDDIHCEMNDERIRVMLGEPEFSTRKVLSDFLKEELKKLK